VSSASFGKSGKQEVGVEQGGSCGSSAVGVTPVPERAMMKCLPSLWLLVSLTVKLEPSLKAPGAPGERRLGDGATPQRREGDALAVLRGIELRRRRSAAEQVDRPERAAAEVRQRHRARRARLADLDLAEVEAPVAAGVDGERERRSSFEDR